MGVLHPRRQPDGTIAWEEESWEAWNARLDAQAAVRARAKASLRDRLCFWCGASVVEGQGLYRIRLGILVHQGSCGHAVKAFERDYSRSTRGRWRPGADVLLLADHFRPKGAA